MLALRSKYIQNLTNSNLLWYHYGQSHPPLLPGLGQKHPNSIPVSIPAHSCQSGPSKTQVRTRHSSAQNSPGAAPTSLQEPSAQGWQGPLSPMSYHPAPLPPNSALSRGSSHTPSFVLLELGPALGLWIFL